jgi:hypothetical protein
MKKIIYLIAIFAFTISCSTNEDIVKKNDKDYYESVGIKSVVSISQDNPIFEKFKNSTDFGDLNKSGRVSSNDFSSIELVTFNSIDDKKLLKIKVEGSNSNLRTSGVETVTEIAAVYSESIDEFVVSWMQEYLIDEQQKSEVVNHYWLDGTKYLSLTINTETKKILTIEEFGTSNGRTAAVTWEKCMKTAYESCSSDWQCAIMCGLIFTECIAATAVACAYVAL